MQGPTNVLIIEDDAVDVKNAKQEFLKINPHFNFETAEDGEEAINKLYGKNGVKKMDPMPDLILVDINLPKMDGNEVVKIIRKDPDFKNVAIFILTGSYTSKDKLATKGLDIPHVVKPLGPNDVLYMYMTVRKLPGFAL